MHSLDWTVVKSRHVLKDRWISVRADTCRMPNGLAVDPFYVIESPNYVHVVAVTRKQEVVLERLYRPGIRQTILELPGGCVDPADATPLEAARRELLEETGYTGLQFDLVGQVHQNPSSHNNVSFCVLATNVELVAQPHLEGTEQIEVLLMPIEQVMEVMGQGGFLQALHVSTLFFAFKALRRLILR